MKIVLKDHSCFSINSHFRPKKFIDAVTSGLPVQLVDIIIRLVLLPVTKIIGTKGLPFMIYTSTGIYSCSKGVYGTLIIIASLYHGIFIKGI